MHGPVCQYEEALHHTMHDTLNAKYPTKEVMHTKYVNHPQISLITACIVDLDKVRMPLAN